MPSSLLAPVYVTEFQTTETYSSVDLNQGFWEELIAYFPFILHGPHRKRRVQLFFYCCVRPLIQRVQRDFSPECEAGQSHSFSAEVKNIGIYLPSPIRLHTVVNKHRENQQLKPEAYPCYFLVYTNILRHGTVYIWICFSHWKLFPSPTNQLNYLKIWQNADVFIII
jgi:hypothetical protein